MLALRQQRLVLWLQPRLAIDPVMSSALDVITSNAKLLKCVVAAESFFWEE